MAIVKCWDVWTSDISLALWGQQFFKKQKMHNQIIWLYLLKQLGKVKWRQNPTIWACTDQMLAGIAKKTHWVWEYPAFRMERKESKTLFTGEIPTQLWESRHSMPLIPTKFKMMLPLRALTGIQSCDYFIITWLAPNHNIIDIGMTHFTLNTVSFFWPLQNYQTASSGLWQFASQFACQTLNISIRSLQCQYSLLLRSTTPITLWIGVLNVILRPWRTSFTSFLFTAFTPASPNGFAQFP